MRALRFFIQGIRDIKTMGTIARTSRFVSKNIVKEIDLTQARCVVELGAGDGPITKYLLKSMRPDAKLLAFEINPHMLKGLEANFEDARLQIVNDDAAKIGEYVAAAGFTQADVIVSAIPFTLIPEDTIIEAAEKHLRPGGKFIQIHYSTAATTRYKRIFDKVKLRFLPINIPPVFLHIAQKKIEKSEEITTR